MRWPSLFNGLDPSLEDWIVDQMHIVMFSCLFCHHFSKLLGFILGNLRLSLRGLQGGIL